MAIELEEAHESGHVLIGFLSGAEILGAGADACEGKGYTRIVFAAEPEDADRHIIAKALHLAAGVAGQRLAGYGTEHEYRGGRDREELAAWYEQHRSWHLRPVFKSPATFERFMTCTAESILAHHEDAFTAICGRFRSHGSLNQDDLHLLVPEKKWLAPGRHPEWWDRFREHLSASSDALERHRQKAVARAAQREYQARNASYQRRYEELAGMGR